jgi:exodeoxyribonuclease VII large subunit
LDIIDIRRQALDDCSYSLRNSMIGIVDDAKASLDTKNASVIALNPDAILRRGYAVCALPDGTIVRDAGQAKLGADVEIRLHKGTLDCVVKQIGG